MARTAMPANPAPFGAPDALEPALTDFDRRVLRALAPWPEKIEDERKVEWRTAWEVGQKVNELDVALVRRVLRGLDHFGYAIVRGYDSQRTRQRWIQSSRAADALEGKEQRG